jgi:hypothetical protein
MVVLCEFGVFAVWGRIPVPDLEHRVDQIHRYVHTSKAIIGLNVLVSALGIKSRTL